jgi:biotin carboxyl carrier protein
MKASRPGRVAELRVQAGDTVGAGETLVVLE